MIKHIVMFRVADTAEKTKQLVAMKSELEKLPSKIPQIIEYEVGLNFYIAPQAFDIVLVSSFESKETLQQYAVHPEHVKFIEFINPFRIEVVVVDYEY